MIEYTPAKDGQPPEGWVAGTRWDVEPFAEPHTFRECSADPQWLKGKRYRIETVKVDGQPWAEQFIFGLMKATGLSPIMAFSMSQQPQLIEYVNQNAERKQS